MTHVSRLLPLVGLLAAACGTTEDPEVRIASEAEIATMTTPESPAPVRAAVETQGGFRTATFAVG